MRLCCAILLAVMPLAAAGDGAGLITPNYAAGERPILVNLTDRAIPQVVAGGGWSTTFFLTNLGTVDTKISLSYYDDDGKSWAVSIPEYNLVGSDFTVSLPVGTTITAELADPPFSATRQGWALLTSPTSKVGGYAVFRQRVAGRPDFEAVVPISSLTEVQSTLGFDHRGGYSTGLALAHPNAEGNNQSVTVQITIRDDYGVQLVQDNVILPPWGHTAFNVLDRYPVTRGKYGVIQVKTMEHPRLALLGLRFNPGGAFTSFHALSVTQ